jgi:type IV pilus assembly protein PilX
MIERRRSVPPACAAPARGRLAARARGFSLIIAMLMLAVIGLASAAIMRNATSADQVANNNRLQTQASQYAQLALRFCESQLALPASSRRVTLQPVVTPAAWTVDVDWTARGVAHTLVAAEIGSTVRPHVPPQCLVEATAMPNVYTVTARGFSADYKADPGTGATRNGSAVWLQATIYADEGVPPEVPAAAPTEATAGALTVRQRVWQQLLTPPF